MLLMVFNYCKRNGVLVSAGEVRCEGLSDALRRRKDADAGTMRVIEERPSKERAVPASEQHQPEPVLDAAVFGRDLRSLRIRRGFDRAADFTALLRHNYGVDVSDRTLYAIERGEQVPRLDFYLAALAALEAEPDYFKPAVRADVAERL